MKIFTRKIGAIPRYREGLPRRRGSPRHGQLRLSEPEDKAWGLSSPPRRGVTRLGEPLRLGGGRLRLGVRAMVQGLCLWHVSGRSHGLVCDCCGLLRGPLCDCWSVSFLE